MGKHRLKYKTMKFPSRQNGTLIPDQDSDSDIQEFALPKKRIVKPGKNPYTTRRRAGCCRTCASVVLSLILIASILCVVVLGWFSLRLKRDLDLLKIRLAEVETSDRSTSKECLKRGKDLQKKLEVLRGSSASHLISDEKNFHSILTRIEILNKTVRHLHTRLKSPQSVSTIHNDIRLLKKAMADTSREMTEVTDKVTQLRKIAHLQNNNVKHLKVQMYNVSVQIAKLSGQPTPRPQVNTATPPWLLRLPADSGSHSKTKLHDVEAEKLRKNITSHVRRDMSKLASFVRRANKTVQNQVHELHVRLAGLAKNVSKHMALIDSLMKRSSLQQNNDKNTSKKHNEMASIPVDQTIITQYKNLTNMVVKLKDVINKHHQRFQEITSDVASINDTVHQNDNDVTPPSSVCNCSLDSVWTAMSKDKKVIVSLKTELQSLKDSVLKITTKDVLPTKEAKESVLTTESTTVEPTRSVLPTTVAMETAPTQQPRTVHKNATDPFITTEAASKSTTGTVAPTTQKDLNEKKRMTDDKSDINAWGGGTDKDQLPQDDPIFNDNSDK